MAGNKHKRRPRQDAVDSAIRPDTAHDWEKDDEELDLEEALFGTSKKRKVAGAGAGDDEEDSMGEMDDEDLFTVDAPLAAQFQVDLNGAIDDRGDSESDEEDEDESDSDSDGESSFGSSGSGAEFRAFSPTLSNDDDDDDDADVVDVEGTKQPSIIVPDDVVDINLNTLNDNARKGKSRQAVWNDPADDLVGVDLGENRRLRKLDRKAVSSSQGEVVDGRVLQERLREQFERLHPPPAWAKQRYIIGTPSLSSLLSSTKSFIAPSTSSSTGRRAALPQGTIELQRVRNANQQNPTTGKRDAAGAGGGVVDFAWHPAKSVGVMAVAGGDRRVRFFNIDGHTNPTLMTLHIPSLPLTRSTFHPSGSSILLVGPRPFYYTYDLTSQRCIRSPRNLFGSKDTPSSPNSLTRHSFSPDGSLLAVAGRRGAVSILDWSNGGAGGVVAELRSGRGGTVSDLIWSGQKELSVLGGRDGAEVEVWDVGQRQVVTKWKDDRAFGGTMLKQSQDSTYTAIGSTTGIVNLYSSSSLSSPTTKSSRSKSLIEHTAEPIKSLEHLTTPINSISFHPSSEVLVAASGSKKDALKMYHLPSCTAFANWPTPTTPLGRITSTAFSASGEYLAVGNQRGTVLLWSLRHYS